MGLTLLCENWPQYDYLRQYYLSCRSKRPAATQRLFAMQCKKLLDRLGLDCWVQAIVQPAQGSFPVQHMIPKISELSLPIHPIQRTYA